MASIASKHHLETEISPGDVVKMENDGQMIWCSGKIRPKQNRFRRQHQSRE